MDRQDAKPSRPSLLAGADRRPAAAAPARILADMENRKPDAAATARSARGWWAFAALAVAASSAWWLAAPDAMPEPAPRMSQATAAAGALSTSSAARIVDAVPDPSTPAMTPSMPAQADARPSGPPPAMRGPPLAEPETVADPFAAVAATAEPAAPSRAEPARRPRARPATTSRRGEPDLLSTLLHNIESSRQTAVADAATLDQLVRRLHGREVPEGQYRSEQIQSNLRDCPPANTVAGLRCRQEICAVYAGRDAACPALD